MPYTGIPLPTSVEMTVFCAITAAAQAAVTLRCFLRAGLAMRRAPAAGVPVSVIVPCRGGGADLEENAASVIDQEYAPGAEFIFVVASGDDPARGRLEKLAAARPGARVRVLVSGAAPKRCGEKSLNLIHGAAQASADTAALVFADSDVRMPPGWLRGLCGGLAAEGVGAFTAPAIFRAGGGISGDIACAWSAVGAQYLDLSSCVVGHSFAITKQLYAGLEVAALWGVSLSDDLALTRRIAARGLKVRYAYGVLPAAPAAPDLFSFIAQTSRWMLYFRSYYPAVWLLGASLTAFKLFALCWAVMRMEWLPVLILFSADLLQVCAAFCALRAAFGERLVPGTRPCLFRLPLAALLCVPALQLMYVLNFAWSALASRVRWGGYVYRLKGPYDVTAEKAA